MTEDRVAPRTAAGRQLAADLPDIREWVGRIEAEAASLDSDELRKAVEALQRQVLNAGARLDGFDHWRERASSKPSDPDDIRWDCICGYSGDPEKVQRHWFALLSAGDKAEAPPTHVGFQGNVND